MKPAPFTYHAPTSVDEAVALLHKLAPDDGRVLAGGQSLVPTMAYRLARPRHLVDINGIESLRTLEVADGRLRIGAGVRHAAFHDPVVDGPLGLLLSQVVQNIAHRPIRARGTFCGSVAHADPASEWCAVAATLDAEMIAVSASGTRTIAARDYFQGIMTTALSEDELLVEVRLPLLPAATRVGFCEFNRRAGDFAIAMAVVAIEVEAGRVTTARIGIGGAEAFPRRSADAERALVGSPLSAQTIAAAAGAAAKASDPLDDEQTTAAYRRDLIATMVTRALEKAS